MLIIEQKLMTRIIDKSLLFKAFAFLAVLFATAFFSSHSAEAAVTVTAATGGTNISADKAANAVSPAWTTLGNIVIAEGLSADFAKATGQTLILTIPSNWSFNAGVGSVTYASGSNITAASISITSTTATISFDTGGTNKLDTLTISGLQVRSNNGALLPNSGNILRTSANPGTAVINGITNDVTNFGSLSQVVGVKNKLAFTTQPSSTATLNTDFSIKPVITLQDQFGNTITSDNSSTITRTAVLSTQTCGGTAGSGTLSSTPANGAAVVAGVMTYTAMQYSYGESIKICAVSSGVTSALSNVITVSNPVPTTTSISPSSKTVGDAQFTLTVNGTNFISGSVVQFAGSSRTTTYISSTQLTATIPATDLTTAGTFNITVFNSTPGGGTSNAQVLTVSAAVDTTPPTVTAFSIPSTSSSLTVSITTFTATDNVGVTGYLLTETSSTPLSSDSGWSSTAPTSYTFSSAGAKTLYAWAKDAAGNISSSLNASVTITLPTTTTISPSQIQSTISAGIIVPNSVLTSSTNITFTQQVQINFTSGSIMTVPISTVMSAGTNVDFSQLSATSDLGSISVPTNYNFVGGLSFGLPSNSLTSTQGVNILIFVGAQYNGQTAVVFKKSYGDTSWSQINTCVINSGFCQFTSTGFSSFIACFPVTPITTPTGGSGIPPKNVIFSGRAFPGGMVKVYRRSPIEKILVNSTSPDYNIQVDDQGNFSQHFISFFESNYIFFLEGIDKNGVSSGILTFTANLLSTNDLTVDNIFIPPTVNIQNSSVARGGVVKVSGYAYPGSSIQLRVDNFLNINSTADKNGYYEATINTANYSPKTHFVIARQTDKSGVSSQFSASENFTVSALKYPQADFNGDGVIDIKDWSIFLSRWNGNATLRAFDDLNMDGKVDISDLSIFLRAMKGL